MSKGIVCDNCGTALALDQKGDMDTGEDAAWITIGTTYQRFDACTVSCAEGLLDGPVRAASEAALEAVAAVIRVIREDREGGSDD